MILKMHLQMMILMMKSKIVIHHSSNVLKHPETLISGCFLF